MFRFLATIGWLALLCLSVVTTPSRSSAENVTTNSPAFWLQTHAGFSSHLTLPHPVSLAFVRPLFVTIHRETAEYIWGTYKLSGQDTEVGLLVVANGLVVAYHPQEWLISRTFDCPSDILNSPAEKATRQIATALGVAEPVLGLYDFGNPSATGITKTWHLFSGYGERSTTITLPLQNIYLERAYAVCSANNGTLNLNGVELMNIRPPFSRVLSDYAPLDGTQLRAGQENVMLTTGNLSLGPLGLLTGIAFVYDGDEAVGVTGENYVSKPLRYPERLGGSPITVYRAMLPLVTR